MTDLIEKLGGQVREEQAREAEIEELAARARGGLDTRKLEQTAQVSAEMARGAFEPLPADFNARVNALIVSSLPAPKPAVESGIERRRGVPKLWVIGPALAAAALLMLWLRPDTAPLALLDRYELEIRGDVVAERDPGDPARAPLQPLRLLPGSEIQLSVRPERGLDGDLDAAAWLSSGADFTRVPTTLEQQPGGGLRLRAQLGTSLPKAGRLLVLVATRGLLDDDAAAARWLSSEAASGTGWQRLERQFESEVDTR